MRLFKIIICATLFISFSTAHAFETRDNRNKLYLGLNIGSYQDAIDEDDALGGTFLIGYDLHKFLAIESRIGLSYDSTEEVSGTDSISTKALLSHASIYLRGNLRFDSFTLFAVGGYSYARLDFKSDINAPSLGINESIDDSEDTDDISYGGGIDLYGNATTALSFQWMRIIDKGDEGEIDAWYIGITHYLDN
ncbi:outer membrane beta-barrel protein [Kaarinaea lacus]